MSITLSLYPIDFYEKYGLMIQLTELRIGNHVIYVPDQDKKINDMIIGILQDQVILATHDEKTVSLNNIVPILLTHEVLINSGFYFTNDDWYECTITYGKLNYNLKHEVCSVSDHDYTNECVLTEYNSIKYLHQLENLYFSITGKELNVVI